MPDTLETKAVKRLMRWVAMLAALVAAPLAKESEIRVHCSDPYTAAIVTQLLQAYTATGRAGFGFGLLNDKSLDGLFLNCIFNAECSVTPWGRAWQHVALEKPIRKEGQVYLSRLPFILLPQQCVVSGRDLGFSRTTYDSIQGGPKGKIKAVESKDGWKARKAKICHAFEAFQTLDEVQILV